MHYLHLHVLVTSSVFAGVPNCLSQDFSNAMVRKNFWYDIAF